MNIYKILVIHGPNMPLLGKISATTGTRLTLDKIDKLLRAKAREMDTELKIFQLYDEAKIVKTISQNRNKVNGILINPTSLALRGFSIREVIAIIRLPVVEVIPREFPFSREYYNNSILKEVCIKRFYSLSIDAYSDGLEHLIKYFKEQ